MTVTISNEARRGIITAPSSKSDLHRKLICAALTFLSAENTVPLAIAYSAKLGEDVLATIDCLSALGCNIEINGRNILITDYRSKQVIPALDCKESGSTLRFLMPVAAALCDEFTVNGSGRLPERPLATALELLRTNGCHIDGERLPLRVRGRMRGEKFALPGDISSQYLSGLLFALPLIGGEKIELTTPLQSSAYVEMTLRVLRDFGVDYRAEERSFILPRGSSYQPPALSALRAEADWSNAAFLLCAGAREGARVTVEGLSGTSSQGDKAIVKLLCQMGACVEQKVDSVTVSGATLRGITLDVSEIPDLVPPLSVLMSVAEGESRITNAARLRLKESDRLEVMARTINALGGNAQQTTDGLIIRGVKELDGCTADSYGDHRIAMSLALAAAWCKYPVTITNAAAVNKSYPQFFSDLLALT